MTSCVHMRTRPALSISTSVVCHPPPPLTRRYSMFQIAAPSSTSSHARREVPPSGYHSLCLNHSMRTRTAGDKRNSNEEWKRSHDSRSEEPHPLLLRTEQLPPNRENIACHTHRNLINIYNFRTPAKQKIFQLQQAKFVNSQASSFRMPY